MIKILKKLSIEETYINSIKAINGKPKSDLILNGEN